jgi:hypothetical protein
MLNLKTESGKRLGGQERESGWARGNSLEGKRIAGKGKRAEVVTALKKRAGSARGWASWQRQGRRGRHAAGG